MYRVKLDKTHELLTMEDSLELASDEANSESAPKVKESSPNQEVEEKEKDKENDVTFKTVQEEGLETGEEDLLIDGTRARRLCPRWCEGEHQRYVTCLTLTPFIVAAVGVVVMVSLFVCIKFCKNAENY